MFHIEEVAPNLFMILLNRVRACYVILDDHPTLVECGFPFEYPELVAALRKIGMTPADIHVTALTHIHLDHAGGAGYLVRDNPAMRVYVHGEGAHHLARPERLNQSVRRAYGNRFHLVGELLPIGSENNSIVAVDSGDIIDIGHRRLHVLATPGHARHHVIYYCPEEGIGFVGDALGSKYLGLPNFALAPPPDYDLPKSKLSLDKVADLHLKSLFFTHNGPYYLARDDDFFPRLKSQHDLWVGTLADLLDQFPDGTNEEMLEAFLERLPHLKSFPTQRFSFGLSVAGILGYLRKSRRN